MRQLATDRNNNPSAQQEDGSSAPSGLKRREWLVNALLGSSLFAAAAAIAHVVARFIMPPPEPLGAGGEWVEVAFLYEVSSSRPKPFVYREEPYVLVRTPGGIRALGRKCTHQNCMVRWQAESSTFQCLCHAAVFDESGLVVSGPAPKPLPALAVRVIGGRVFVGGVKNGGHRDA